MVLVDLSSVTTLSTLAGASTLTRGAGFNNLIALANNLRVSVIACSDAVEKSGEPARVSTSPLPTLWISTAGPTGDSALDGQSAGSIPVSCLGLRYGFINSPACTAVPGRYIVAGPCTRNGQSARNERLSSPSVELLSALANRTHLSCVSSRPITLAPIRSARIDSLSGLPMESYR